jgi:uncharacterized Zn finger protein
MWFGYRPYVPVSQRKAQAAREIEKRKKKGQNVSPVVIEGRAIAKTFWGKAWCDNLESYSDFANRLPRGRTYVRNGSVVDLQIEAGKIAALVSGSEMYKVGIDIDLVPAKQWAHIKSRCAGQIGSLVELLQGKLSNNVIEIVTAKGVGLFPRPGEIKMRCSCPDWAGMCKHIAAVLYGVGARLDHQPDLLFLLRQVDHLELIEEAVSRAGEAPPAATKTGSSRKTLDANDVAGVFGIEFAAPEAPIAEVPKPAAKPRSSKKPAKAAPAEAKPKPSGKKGAVKPRAKKNNS